VPRSLPLILLAALAAAACPRRAPEPPRPRGAPWVRALAAPAGTAAIRGVDADDAGTVYVAIDRAAPAAEPVAVMTAITGAAAPPRWESTIAASAGPLAVAGAHVVAAIAPRAGASRIDLAGRTIAVRGAPGAALVGLAADTGAVAWVLPVGASGWCVVSAIDGAANGDAIAVGSFSGNLRAGDRVVTAAGSSDGFALRVDPTGAVRWLVRMGGSGADALTAVATATGTDAVAVAGSITGEADFRGTPLVAHDPRKATADVAIALLDDTGLPRWGRVLGGDGQDSAAGVALGADGTVAVAATVREVVHLGGEMHVVRGTSDTLIAVYDGSGAPAASTLIGGQDYDGARGLVAPPGGGVIAGGWFSGTLRTPHGDALAGGGDDAFLAHLSGTAAIGSIDVVTGDGREEITGLAASRAGVAIGIGHTAAVTVLGTALPAPADPGGGAAIAFIP
jgi:hypothetical protein